MEEVTNKMDSILTTIKKLLGITEECEDFDADIIVHINTAIARLRTLGVGPIEGYQITDETSTWTDYLKGDIKLNDVKQYIYIKVKMVFDPPTSASVITALKETLSELEFAVSVTVDSGGESNE